MTNYKKKEEKKNQIIGPMRERDVYVYPSLLKYQTKTFWVSCCQ